MPKDMGYKEGGLINVNQRKQLEEIGYMKPKKKTPGEKAGKVAGKMASDKSRKKFKKRR